MEVIKLENISKSYTGHNVDVCALKDINITINDGEFVAITGASGSGKSTLMNILGCLDTQSSGKYYLNGTDTSKLCDRKLSALRNQNIGFIFQSYNLLPALSAIDNVALPLLYRGYSRGDSQKIAYKALQDVGLEDRADHLPCQLSGGQQQRIAIARALVYAPRLILADEPTGNLDSKTSRLVMEQLSALNKMGCTVIVITHNDLPDINLTRTITIKDGCLVQ